MAEKYRRTIMLALLCFTLSLQGVRGPNQPRTPGSPVSDAQRTAEALALPRL